jgi:hypothetical protein
MTTTTTTKRDTDLLDKLFPEFDALTQGTELLDEEPRTLNEIATKVGFPFKVRALLEATRGSVNKVLPVGTELTIIGQFTQTGQQHPIYEEGVTDESTVGHMIPAELPEAVNPKLKRWILIK